MALKEEARAGITGGVGTTGGDVENHVDGLLTTGGGFHHTSAVAGPEAWHTPATGASVAQAAV